VDRDSLCDRGRWRKKIRGLGDSSVHWQLAILAVETGISPRELADLEPRMLWTMFRYLASKNQQRRRKR